MEVKNDTKNMDRLMKEFKDLNSHSLEIGVFGSDDSFMAMIANVHEFGLTIRPKGKFLTIPTREAGDRKPRDIPDLFKPKGVMALAVEDKRKRGKSEEGFIVMFWLVKKVNIPERSFVRSTFDENQTDWEEFFLKRLDKIIAGEMTAENLYQQLGARIASDIQEKMTSLKTPGKSKVTLQRDPNKTNPLINTGRLRQSVTWKVVKD